MDLALLEEMIPYDASTDEDGTGNGGSDGDSDSDSDSDADSDSDGPPRTDPNDTTAPALATTDCGASETTLNGVCVAVGPAAVSFRFATDEQARISVATSGPERSAVVSDDWALEHHAAVLCLEAGTAVGVRLTFTDVNENAAFVDLEVEAAGGPAVAVTEVLADPNGPEPAQEFVEIVNYGDTAVDLSGWMIDDNMDADGDLMASGTVLAPGQVGVIASVNYDPAEGGDPGPAAGALIIDIGSSIGTGGLKNTEAETIELYDSGGALISRYAGAAGNPKEGKSAWRILAELPDGDPLSWSATATDTPTPGSAPMIP